MRDDVERCLKAMPGVVYTVVEAVCGGVVDGLGVDKVAAIEVYCETGRAFEVGECTVASRSSSCVSGRAAVDVLEAWRIPGGSPVLAGTPLLVSTDNVLA